MHIGYHNDKHIYQMGSGESRMDLDQVTSEKDLDITFQDNLQFTKHLANSMLGLIHSSSDRRSPEKSSKTIKRLSEWTIQHQTHHLGPTNTSEERESWHVASVQNPEQIRGHRLLKMFHNLP